MPDSPFIKTKTQYGVEGFTEDFMQCPFCGWMWFHSQICFALDEDGGTPWMPTGYVSELTCSQCGSTILVE